MPYMSETFIVGAQLSICFLATFPIEKKSSLGFGGSGLELQFMRIFSLRGIVPFQ